MKKLCGLVCLSLSVLLGVALVAPHPSEASGADVTFQVDTGTPVHILGNSTTCPSGYNVCYTLNFNAANAVGNNNKSYKIVNHPGTSATGPKLYLNDITGPDSMKFNGVDFVPTTTSSWPNTETHVVTIQWQYTFDGPLNTNNSGHQGLGLSIGGYVQGGGTPAYTQYDYLQFDGTGTFSPSVANAPLLNVPPAILPNLAPDGTTKNTAVLKFPGIANQANITYWTLSQQIAFPTFGCDSDGSGSGTSCKQTVKPRLTFTAAGPDLLAITTSAIVQFSGTCKVTPADPDVTEPSGNPIPCHASGKKNSGDDIITQAITNQVNTDIAEGIAAGGVAAIACTAADNCPCVDPYTCKGKIVINMTVTPATAGTFHVTGSGEGIGDPTNPATPVSYPIITNTSGNGSHTFQDIPTVGTGPWIIAEGPFPPIGDGTKQHWETDQISCVSQLNVPATYDSNGVLISPAVNVTIWSNNQGSDKSPLTVNVLGGGDTLTCTWHVHQSSGN